MTLFRRCVAVVAVVLILVGIWQIRGASDGLTVTHVEIGTIPATVFRPEGAGRVPVIVIAHGFAGSQQLMLPFALTLARNGYGVVTFDFPGHGRNPQPLLGGLADDNARNRTLQVALSEVVAFTRKLAWCDGRLALLGHSMATDIIVRAAVADPTIAATVAVSLLSPAVTAALPRNLLVIDGALEPAMVLDEGFRVVALASGGMAQERETYGRFADGTARRLSLSGGVEHIGVLFSAQSLSEALAWMNQSFGRTGSGFIDARAPWLGILYLGLVALAWQLSLLLPVVTAIPAGGGAGWRRLLLLAIVPAVLTPLLLWKLPTDFLPILLGDYLAVHFFIYGLLTAIGMAVLRMPGIRWRNISWVKLVVAVLAMGAYAILAIGLPIDAFVTSFVPNPGRVLLIPAVLAGTLPYFVADEWLTRGPNAPASGYAVTKLCFVLSLVLAIALNPPRLFFLIIIIPVILIFLILYGLFSVWAYRRTGQPLVAALANALAFAYAIAVTFPVVGG